jgi:hypothetical protein
MQSFGRFASIWSAHCPLGVERSVCEARSPFYGTYHREVLGIYEATLPCVSCISINPP